MADEQIENEEVDNPVVDAVVEGLSSDDTIVDEPEAVPEVEAAADDEPEVEEATEPPSRLSALLGDEVPETTSEAGNLLLDKMTKEELDEGLTPTAKVLIQTIRIEAQKEIRAAKAAMAKKDATFAQREAELAKGFKELRARQDDLDRLFRDPSFKAAMKGPEGEAPKDPTSAEYIDHRAHAIIAERLQKALKPVAVQAERTQRERAWDAIVEKYPDMGNETSELRTLAFGMRAEDVKAGRQPMDPERYIKLAQGEIARKQVSAQQAAMSERRRQAARKIQRATAPVHKSATDEIPEHIRKAGGADLLNFLRNNPAARARIDAERGAR